MGLITEKVIMKWNGNNKKHYIEKGYDYTVNKGEFTVSVKDLPYTSKIYVKAQCDSCLETQEKEIMFGTVNNNMIKNDGLYICKKCASIINGKKKRNTTENFKKQVFDLVGDEYTVLGEYTVANTKLTMRHNCDSCGNHEYEVSPAKFLNDRRCPKCANNIKHTFEEIKSKIKLIHPNIEVISEFYKEVGVTDIRNTHYINCKCLIDGNEWSPTVASVLSGCGCPKCRAKFMGDILRFDFEYIKQELFKINKNILILSDTYEGALSYLKVKCLICNNEWEATFDGLNGGHGCPKCAIKNNSGENAWNYNPDLTQEERELKRNFLGEENYGHWRTSVFERDSYVCRCCGDKSIKGKKVILNAHHLNGYHWDKVNRVNVDNGITLCKDCHSDFHKKYSRKDNTKQQYEEYKILMDNKNKEIQNINILKITS